MTQYHYTSWEDHSTPESLSSVLEFIRHLRADIKTKNSNSPILTHCSAGVGRTGSFITIDRLLLQIENDENIDVFETVIKIRRDRYLLVQTEVRNNFILLIEQSSLFFLLLFRISIYPYIILCLIISKTMYKKLLSDCEVSTRHKIK